KSVLAKQIAGTNHFSALQTIMNGLSESAKESGMSFTDYAAALEKCDGTAQNMANTMIDNLAGDMTILDSSIDGVKIALSEKLNPIMRDLVQYITEKMPEIQESSEKAFDVVVVIAEWCKKNMPEIKKVASDILPIITGIGSGIAGWAVSSKIAVTVKKLFDVVKAGEVVTRLLNTTMLANPAVAVTTAIVALTGAIVAYNLAQKDEISIAERVNEKYKDQIEKAEDVKRKIDDLKNSFYDSADAIDYEFDRTKDLWRELHNLAGESGEVDNANRKRAEYIMKELNEALGTEYSMTGNQIENYQNLSKEIDNVIEKKQAEALLDAYLANSAEIAKTKAEAYDNYIEARKKADTTKTAMDEAENDFNMINSTGMTAEEIVDYHEKYGSLSVMSEDEYRKYQENGKWNTTRGRFTREQLNSANAYLTAKAENEKENDFVKSAKESYEEASDYQRRANEARAEIEDGHYNIEKTLYTDKRTALDDKNATEDEKITAYKEKIEKLKYGAEIAIDTGNQTDVDGFLQELSSAFDEGQIAGLSPRHLATPDFVAALKKIADNKYDLSEFTVFGKDSGIDITEFLGKDYSKILSEQINSEKIKKGENGYNVDDFLEWAAKSETKIAKEAWDDIAVYIQNQIKTNDGYDITPILKTIKEAGVDIKEAFDDDYMGIIQKQIDEGLDPTELINWFVDTDKEAAESFKKNYKELSQDMLDEGFDP
ncbi:MAG: phage tail tape measure protein, partial [Ruminococcus sp.]|nr:phage tail tape measure protein [Ruminococcus sp.]